MRLLHFSCRNSCNKDYNSVQLKRRQNIVTVVRPSDAKRSASLAGINKNEDFQIADKTQRVELDVPTSNVWDLVINIAEHLKKHMHFQEKQGKTR